MGFQYVDRPCRFCGTTIATRFVTNTSGGPDYDACFRCHKGPCYKGTGPEHSGEVRHVNRGHWGYSICSQCQRSFGIHCFNNGTKTMFLEDLKPDKRSERSFVTMKSVLREKEGDALPSWEKQRLQRKLKRHHRKQERTLLLASHARSSYNT